MTERLAAGVEATLTDAAQLGLVTYRHLLDSVLTTVFTRPNIPGIWSPLGLPMIWLVRAN